MIPKDFNEAHEEVVKLVKTFGDNHAKYLEPQYNETAARKDFIDKLFIALGWDVNHNTQTNPYEQEVKVEKNVSIAARVKKADYAFFLKPNFAQERFFVEAKRPSAILDTPDNCFQTIRYAFSSSKAALSILTNFNELYIIDCRFRPDIQTATNHIHKKFHFSDFYDVTKFGEFYYLFSREAVEAGKLDEYALTLPKPKGKVVQRRLFGDNYQEVDDAFLVQLEVYREELAKMFKRKNTHLDSDSLTEAVQRTIDRLVFIRFLEDKLIEPSTILDKLSDEPHPWKKFIAKSREFDKTYNGIIFKEHPVIDRDDFVVDDRVFNGITDSLADEYSPYHFNYIPIHILGSIYERFLGNVIVLRGKNAEVEQKPEVRKAGGVFYTPQYIVRYIVENTIGELLNGKTPKDVVDMRFADIACGSGSFLLGAYEYLLGWHTAYYNGGKNKTQKEKRRSEAKKAGCLKNDDGTFALSFEQKKEILVTNLYGVDIDRQAYEVTQLSLFLKLLEEETQGTKQQFLTGHRESLLPDLRNNIVCGNAIVDWDITGSDLFEQIDNDKQMKLNPMSFEQKFPEITRAGGFDAIIGNPPYGADFDDSIKAYLNRKYEYQTYQLDSYIVFLEKALTKLLKNNGYLGYIIPNPWLTNLRQTKIRELVILRTRVRNVVHFKYKVFSQAVVDTEVLIVQNAEPNENTVVINLVEDQNRFETGRNSTVITHKQNEWIEKAGETINIFLNSDEKKLIRNLESRKCQTLEALLHINVGIKPYQTGKGIPKQTKETVSTRPFDSDQRTDNSYRQYLRGTDIKRYLISPEKTRFIKFGVWLAEPRPAANFDAAEKLFMRQTGDSLVAALDSEQLLSLNNMHVLVPRKVTYNLRFILGLLNSKLLNWLYQRSNPEVGEALAEIKKEHIAQLPICVVDIVKNVEERAMHDVIVRSVEQMMEAKPKLAAAASDRDRDFWQNKCDSLERTIDHAVYKLYNLTPDEIALVEKR